MKITKKLLFLLCITSVFASRAMNKREKEIYEKTFSGLRSITSSKKLLNQEILFYSQFYKSDYQDDIYYANIQKIFNEIEIKDAIFAYGETNITTYNKNVMYIDRLENEICVAQNRKREHDEDLAKRRKGFNWKAYGSYISFFILGIASKSLLDKYRG